MNIFEKINEKFTKDKIKLKAKLDKQLNECCKRLTSTILNELNDVLNSGVMDRVNYDSETTRHGQTQIFYTRSGLIGSLVMSNAKIVKVWHDIPCDLKRACEEQVSKQLSEETGTNVVVDFVGTECTLSLNKEDD